MRERSESAPGVRQVTAQDAPPDAVVYSNPDEDRLTAALVLGVALLGTLPGATIVASLATGGTADRNAAIIWVVVAAGALLGLLPIGWWRLVRGIRRRELIVVRPTRVDAWLRGTTQTYPMIDIRSAEFVWTKSTRNIVLTLDAGRVTLHGSDTASTRRAAEAIAARIGGETPRLT